MAHSPLPAAVDDDKLANVSEPRGDQWAAKALHSASSQQLACLNDL